MTALALLQSGATQVIRGDICSLWEMFPITSVLFTGLSIVLPSSFMNPNSYFWHLQ